MPLVQVHTNVSPSDEEGRALLGRLSRLLSEHTGKDERWVMTRLVPGQAMTFAGTDAPAAYVEVKNLGGFAPDAAVALTAALTETLEDAIGVPPARVYVEMADPPRELFGWKRQTFA